MPPPTEFTYILVRNTIKKDMIQYIVILIIYGEKKKKPLRKIK